MVRLWAEKEMRNLKRLISAGIRCPEPMEVRENVLVMSFVGDNEGWCVPSVRVWFYRIDNLLIGHLRALKMLKYLLLNVLACTKS
jgi:RIO-like serine/threonine protein kinase